MAEKEKMVKIRLPREKNKDAEFVSVNEKTYLIKLGETVEVPESVAALIACRDEMLDEAYEYESKNAR